MPRKRLKSTSTKLVFSTRPKVSNILSKIQGRTDNLHKPIIVGSTIGKSYEAVMLCEKVVMATKSSELIGAFEGPRNIYRRHKHS